MDRYISPAAQTGEEMAEGYRSNRIPSELEVLGSREEDFEATRKPKSIVIKYY